MSKLKVVHYINQFFASIGGEEKADYSVEKRPGEVIGPGVAFANAFKDDAEIIGTIICGDTYYSENIDKASEEILSIIKEFNPDIFIAGPAFNAGRYGFACASIASKVQERLGILSLTGMYVENPGADMFKDKIYIISTKNNAAGMKDAVNKISSLALKLYRGCKIGASCEEGYIPNGVRVNFFEKERGSKRAVKMLLKKLSDEEFITEYPMPNFDRVSPNPAVIDIRKCKIALVTSGGIVPKGNPDHIESSSASRYGEYDITGVEFLNSDNYETAHGGYDPVYANENANRVLPIDVLRDMEKKGLIGELHNKFYSTVGNGTSVASSKSFAKEIAEKLVSDEVDAVILTSTWGTCTRCGATMVKEIEKAGLPVVHICTVTPISLTVGANRIVPAIAIPHPLGNPNLSYEDEKNIRYKLVEKALKALTIDVDDQTIFENWF